MIQYYQEVMAINIISDEHINDAGLNAIDLEIANGDLEALTEIAKDYDLADRSDVIAFAIGVLKKAHGGPIAVVDKDGRYNKFKPSDSLRRSNGATESE